MSKSEEELDGPDPSPEALARHILIGLLIETTDLGRRGLSTAGGAAMKAGRFWGTLLEPVLSTPLLAPVRRGTAALARRGSDELERWARLGRESEIHSKDLARQLLHIPVEEVVEVLRDDPKTRALVRDQAQALLVELQDDDDLKAVVRIQGDEYIDHVREQPEAVRGLLTTQSTSLATELANVVRGWMTALDAHLDHYVGKILRWRGLETSRSPRRLGDDAGFASRLLAFVADSSLLTFVTVAGGWISASLLRILGLDVLDCNAMRAGTDLAETLCQIALWGGLAVAALLPIAFLLLFWTAGGRTPGKALAGVRIVARDGSQIGFTTSAMRVAGYGVSLWTLGLGFLAILFNRYHLGWHDRIARTRVIYTWQHEEPPEPSPEERTLADR